MVSVLALVFYLWDSTNRRTLRNVNSEDGHQSWSTTQVMLEILICIRLTQLYFWFWISILSGGQNNNTLSSSDVLLSLPGVLSGRSYCSTRSPRSSRRWLIICLESRPVARWYLYPHPWLPASASPFKCGHLTWDCLWSPLEGTMNTAPYLSRGVLCGCGEAGSRLLLRKPSLTVFLLFLISRTTPTHSHSHPQETSCLLNTRNISELKLKSKISVKIL